MSESETRKFSGSKSEKCPGACPGGGIENSPFFWLILITCAAAGATMVVSGMTLTTLYPMTSQAWWWWSLISLCVSGLFMALGIIFSATGFPDAAQPGSKLHGSHWMKANAPLWAWLIISAASFGFVQAFRRGWPDALLEAFDTRETSVWTATPAAGDPNNAIPFAAQWYGSQVVIFMGQIWVFAVSVKWLEAVIFPLMKKKKPAASGSDVEG